jgi:hypothetical protein
MNEGCAAVSDLHFATSADACRSATGKLEASLDPGAAERFAVGPLFSPDGRWLAASFENGRVVIWDTPSWDVHSVMEADRGGGIRRNQRRRRHPGDLHRTWCP